MLKINVDGASRGNPGQSGIGAVATDGTKIIFEISEYIGIATNNVAEYRALIRALEELKSRNIKEAKIESDSQLIVEQMNGNYRVKDETLKVLFNYARTLSAKLSFFRIDYIPREKNKAADKLANLGIDNK